MRACVRASPKAHAALAASCRGKVRTKDQVQAERIARRPTRARSSDGIAGKARRSRAAQTRDRFSSAMRRRANSSPRVRRSRRKRRRPPPCRCAATALGSVRRHELRGQLCLRQPIMQHVGNSSHQRLSGNRRKLSIRHLSAWTGQPSIHPAGASMPGTALHATAPPLQFRLLLRGSHFLHHLARINGEHGAAGLAAKPRRGFNRGHAHCRLLPAGRARNIHQVGWIDIVGHGGRLTDSVPKVNAASDMLHPDPARATNSRRWRACRRRPQCTRRPYNWPRPRPATGWPR